MKKIVLPAMIAACCLILLAQARGPSAPTDPIKIDKLSDWFEGVSFSHPKHSGAMCEKCHHMGFEGGSGCLSCHPKEKTSPSEVSLKDAYHGVCFKCHAAKGKDVKEGCEKCHKARKLAVPKNK